jgi:transketolase
MIRKEAFLADLAKPEAVPTRDGYGKALVELGERDDRVVVLTGDLAESTRVHWFAERFPRRFVEVGVAEQNMMGVAAGLALSGKIPFVSSYAVFCPGRAWDQLRVGVCYNRANVKVAGAHAGISVGPDGATHQGLEDIASVRVLPNIIVVVPADWLEAKKATLAIAGVRGPCYIRFGREKVPTITTDSTPFAIGKAEVYRDGADVCIVACGQMVAEALVAAQQLEEEGLSAMVINNHTIKPIDRRTLAAAARQCGCVVTAEEHQITGGMGSAVMEVLAEECPVPVERVGMPDCFGESGKPAELLAKYGMTAKNVVRAAKSALKRKLAALPLAPVDKDKADALLRPVSQGVIFHMHGGGTISDLLGLHRALLSMSEAVFKHHTAGRNDFASWVENVQKDKALADALRKQGSRSAMARIVGQRLGQLHTRV